MNTVYAFKSGVHVNSSTIKKITKAYFECDYMTHEVYECYEPPPKPKTKALDRNKRKYGNRS